MKSVMLVLALVLGLVVVPAASAQVFVTTAGVGNVGCVGGQCFINQPVVVPSSLSFFSASNPALFVNGGFHRAFVGVGGGFGNQVVVRQGFGFGGRRVVVNNGFGGANVVVGGGRSAVVVNNGAVAVRAGRANVVVGGGNRVIVRRRGFFR